MLLVTSNAQGELSPLERGIHALNSGKGVREYATAVGLTPGAVTRQRQAAEVFSQLNGTSGLEKKTEHLAEIHAAPRWLWPALVDAMLGNGWSVEQTREQAGRFKDFPTQAPKWLASGALLAIVAGLFRLRDIERIDELIAKAEAEVAEGEDAEELDLSDIRFATYSEAMEFFEKALTPVRRRRIASAKAAEDAKAMAARLFNYVPLSQWSELAEPTRRELLPPDAESVSPGNFNKQENAAIEWAMWSWNPITGCLHDCPYCYARDIATSARQAKVYPYGFEPTLRPRALLAPRSMRVPKDAAQDTRFRNVFTGSMADMFGRWVPKEWIEAVLAEIRAASEWNFLCLTKFPKRMAEFEIPSNAWMGTTVDLQARVPAAEAGFANVGAKVKWLSIEPLIEPLRFKHLDRFDWMVIGGASRSSATPEWRPPFSWIADLVRQARDAGVKVYFKTNLGIENRILELPFDAPIQSDPFEAPPVFHYLGQDRNAA